MVNCYQNEANDLRGELILQTSDDMMKYRTAYDIQQTIILSMSDNDGGTFLNNVPDYNESYPQEIYLLIRQAAKEQDEIGQRNFFDGHISKTWSIAQESFYRTIPTCQRKGRTWSKRLIHSIYTFT